MIIKIRISQFAHRLTIKARAWLLHHQIEALYHRQQKLAAHHERERRMQQEERDREFAALAAKTAHAEAVKRGLYAQEVTP